MDLKQYWKEIAAKSGLSAEKLAQGEALLADPELGKLLETGFKPLPDYSRDLDNMRTRATAEEKARFESWYKQTVADPWADIQARNAKYRELYGDLDPNAQPNGNGNGNGNGNNMNQSSNNGLTLEKVAELLDSKIKDRDSKFVQFAHIRENHMLTFRKPLDTTAFEKAWADHPDWGNSMQVAWEKFVEPEIQAIRKLETDALIEKRVEERVAELASQRGIPVVTGPKAFSPMFDRNADVAKLDSSAQDNHSRQSFISAFQSELNKPG